jgi:AraC-like DNA-binding protein
MPLPLASMPRPLQNTRMTYQEALPAPALQTLVAAYWSVDGAADGTSTSRRVLPDGCADLICDFAGASPSMRWVGTMTRAIEVQGASCHNLFGIRFASGGLFPLLGAPLSLLTDDSAEFDALPARAWSPPLNGWCEDRSFAARCARADASILAVLPQLSVTTTMLLIQRLPYAPVLPTVSSLADDAGMGLRTLQRHFMDQLGVSPGQHLRYLRFERARQLLSRRDRRAIDIAMAAGYSDQAHFVREFRRFSGITPGRWR